MQIKTIYTLWIAQRLAQAGFQIINVRPNPQRPWFNCYDFEETPELLAEFTRVTKLKKTLQEGNEHYVKSSTSSHSYGSRGKKSW